MLIGRTDEERIYNYLHKEIKNVYGACALWGNIRAESGCSSINLQNSGNKRLGLTDKEYTTKVDTGEYINFIRDSLGYGLAQWTYWNRKQNLFHFMKDRQLSIGDLEGQLQFLVKELKESYSSVWRALCNAKSIKEASDIVLTKFEKPKIQDDRVKQLRASYGSDCYMLFVAGKVEGGSTMGVLCGWAAIDEKGKAKGGQAGDQTGNEVKTGSWYNFGQTVVLRFKDRALAERYASKIKGICLNNHVGYDQSQRTTLFTELKAVNWDTTKLIKDCETDCSAMVAVALNAVGINISKDIYTGNMVNAIMATGMFEKLTEKKYLSSGDYLLTGDILVKAGKHTISVLADGTKAEITAPTKTNIVNTTSVNIVNNKKPEAAKCKDTSVAGTYKTKTDCNLRIGAGTKKTIIGVVKANTLVKCYKYYNVCDDTKWLFVAVGSYTGYISEKCLIKI